ncbi:molybdopterin biosynthesis protein [Phreatobacter stygius]|uniref:Molybdopterin molybdenumtransferase n=1 Tax=Phreatobacter stygius TaxID=1940610 RepID=A0A4D7B8A2_9HYPH|nr:molybdopterin biosynthesis protein [Phreatobacter stygius]QCI64227.1 molybdopterin biosynthesis protein [Phreatobacter stygius]
MTERSSLDQDQFLTVLTREEAVSRFRAALAPKPLGSELVPLDRLVGRVLATDIAAPVDTPPFDRSVVDGFALHAGDVATASDTAPSVLALNGEVIACGFQPKLAVRPGTATPIATGGPVPRGADAVVMIEQTDIAADGRLVVKRALAPGQNIAFAGSDIARGETLLRRGTTVGAREIGMLAAVGLVEAQVWLKPRVAVISTGDELVAPGEPLRPAAIYDSNGAIVAAALEENGCEPVRFGAIADDAVRLEAAMREAHATCDAVILSGGTSKGAGDLTYRIVGALGSPGIVAHGVALKPGKPLCLAVADGKPVVILPGFPTSAMFTFHDIVVPVLRILAGQPERQDVQLTARVPVRVPSDLGRTEFVMVALSASPDGPVAYPIGKGSGSVTAFSQADGFVTIDALAEAMPAETVTPVTLFTPHLHVPDLVIMGSHCVGLDAVIGRLVDHGLSARSLALGSLGGLSALRRGECDLAPIHLFDPKTGLYNRPFLGPDMSLIAGWRRMQGIVHARTDTRFAGITDAKAAVDKALADPDCLMVNRNQGAGTRILIDQLLEGRKPPGYWNQPRSHNAVAASVAQGRADWGVAIRPVAEANDLGFIPLAEEHYDFAVAAEPAKAAAIEAFRAAIVEARDALEALGFAPADREPQT